MTPLIFAATGAAFLLAFASATWAAYSAPAAQRGDAKARDRAANRFVAALFLTILFSALSGAGAMWLLA